MQNRYVGDIGDFGKLGLLSFLSKETGLSIGINCYLTEPVTQKEKKNSDGKYIEYENLKDYDVELYSKLNEISHSNNRNVVALKKANLVRDTKYFEASLVEDREKWHQDALVALEGCKVVFLDPDNGLEVKSAKGKSLKKYVKKGELADYYNKGSSVIYYQHQARKKDEDYIKQNKELLKDFPDATLIPLKFIKISSRYYFFIVQPDHKEQVDKCLEKMLETKWKDCFKRLL